MIATRAFISTFREEYITPEEQFDWDEYPARLGRYALYEALYNNTAYRGIERWSVAYKNKYELYKHIRGIYNPAYRLVELISAKTMGGMIDWTALKTGAIPVTDADDTLIEALLQVMKWSKWGQAKTLYARRTAMLGDCGLWIADEPGKGKVRIEIMHPSKIKSADFDSVGNVIAASIEYEREWENENGQERSALFRMDVDKGTFATFKDDAPFGWDDNPPEWENPYGFVPLVKADYKDMGLLWGANAFHAGVNKFNEANDAASILNDGIRKASDPPFAATGVTMESDIEFSGQLDDGTSTTEPTHQRDQANIIGLPKDASITSLAPQIDVAGIASNIQNLLMEIERDYPQLALQRLRESSGDKTGPAIKNAYGDAVGLLQEAMGNLDDGQIRAMQMAVSIGGMRGYEGFDAYNLDSYAAGDLDFYIKERQLFEDTFTADQRVQILRNLPDNPAVSRYILVNELEISEEEADLMIAEQVNQQMMKQQRQAAQFGQGQPPQQPVTVGRNPQPQLTAGQGAGDNGTGDVSAEVQRILSEIGAAG